MIGNTLSCCLQRYSLPRCRTNRFEFSFVPTAIIFLILLCDLWFLGVCVILVIYSAGHEEMSPWG